MMVSPRPRRVKHDAFRSWSRHNAWTGSRTSVMGRLRSILRARSWMNGLTATSSAPPQTRLYLRAAGPSSMGGPCGVPSDGARDGRGLTMASGDRFKRRIKR
jgi:hypothetical protein